MAGAEIMCRFGYLAMQVPELSELEINPLLARATGAIVVDAREALGLSKTLRT